MHTRVTGNCLPQTHSPRTATTLLAPPGVILQYHCPCGRSSTANNEHKEKPNCPTAGPRMREKSLTRAIIAQGLHALLRFPGTQRTASSGGSASTRRAANRRRATMSAHTLASTGSRYPMPICAPGAA